MLDLFNKSHLKAALSSHKGVWTFRYQIYGAVIILLFLLFLTSNLWISLPSKAQNSPIGTTLTFSTDHKVILKNWTYNQAEHFMLVDIGTLDQSVESDFSYSLSIKDNNNHALSADIPFQNDDAIMLQIGNVPNCSSITVSVTLKYKADDKKQNSSSDAFYGVIHDLPINNELPKSMSDQEYTITSWKDDQNVLSAAIKQNEQKVSEIEQSISKANEKIGTLTESEKYQTPDEKRQTESQIQTLKNSISSWQKSIAETQASIEKYQEKIQAINSKISQFKSENSIT